MEQRGARSSLDPGIKQACKTPVREPQEAARALPGATAPSFGMGNRAMTQLLRGPRPSIQRCSCADSDKKRPQVQRVPSWIGGPVTAAHGPSTSEIRLDATGSRAEFEAEKLADRVAQGLPANGTSEAAGERIQAAPQGAGGDILAVAHEVAAAIDAPRGGDPLSTALRARVEPLLGANFTDVRVHQDTEAARLTDELQARAFTSGSHIWLGAGENAADTRLMAHELVHVVQQRATPPAPERPPVAQRVHRYWSLPGGRGFSGGPGERVTEWIATEILPPSNPDLYSEVNIPGGSRAGVVLGSTGRADLYMASRTIGVNFDAAGSPLYLPSHRSLKQAGKRTDHAGSAAPAGRRAGDDPCAGMPAGPAICRMDKAPASIEIGDIKPEYAGEVIPGTQQVQNYVRGVKTTAELANRFAGAHPGQVQPANATWTPDARPMTSLQIPPDYAKPGASRLVPVVLYEDEAQKTFFTEPAALVLKNAGGGVFTYDFIPQKVTSTGASGDAKTRQEAIDAALKAKVEAGLKAPPKRTGGALRRPNWAARVATRGSGTRRVQRKAKDDFNFATWKRDDYDPWRADAVTFAGADPLLGREIKPSQGAQEIERAAALEELAQRHPGLAVSAPAGSAAKAHDLDRARIWIDYGGLLGRLRQVFGTTFVRVVDFYEKVRDRVHKLFASKTSGLGSSEKAGGSLAGAVIHSLLTLARNLAGIFIKQVANRLAQALENGAKAFIEQQFGEAIAEVAAWREKLDAFEAAIRDDIVGRIEALVKPFQEQIDQVRKVFETLNEISTWVNRAKWVWRVASCGAPPLLGCLWGIFGSALIEAGVAAITASCWFQRNIMLPVVAKLGPIMRLPDVAADFILDLLRKILPKPLHILLGEPTRGAVAVDAGEIDCEPDAAPMTPETEQVIAIFEELGEDKVRKLLEASKNAGADGSKPMTVEQARKLKDYIAVHGEAQLDAFLRLPASPGRGVSLEEALDHIEQQVNPSPPGAGGLAPQQPPMPAPAPPPVTSDPKLGRVIRQFAALRPNEDGFWYKDIPAAVGATFTSMYISTLRQKVVGGYVSCTVTRLLPGGSAYVHVPANQPLYDFDGAYVGGSPPLDATFALGKTAAAH